MAMPTSETMGGVDGMKARRKVVVVTSTSISKNELMEDVGHQDELSSISSPVVGVESIIRKGMRKVSEDTSTSTNEVKNKNGESSSINNVDGPSGELFPVKVPIVGFETMEERAKFTVFKLRVENDKLNETWLVFRRYTDFVRLHTKLKDEVQNLDINLPPKRWLRDNFETAFLEERMKGLQAFVDSILVQPLLAQLPTVRKFFCLDEPPSLEGGDDSRSWSGSIEESCLLKHKLIDREREIELLRAELALVSTQKDNLQKIIRNCKSCNPKAASMNSPYGRILTNPSPFAAVPSSSSSSDHGSPRRVSYVGSSSTNSSPIHHSKRRNNSESSIRSNLKGIKNGERVNGVPDLSSINLSDSSKPQPSTSPKSINTSKADSQCEEYHSACDS